MFMRDNGISGAFSPCSDQHFTKTGLCLGDDHAALEELRERTEMSHLSESPAKIERNMSKKFKLSDKTTSANNIEASNSELFKNATVMTG